jgi:hypothetical protein
MAPHWLDDVIGDEQDPAAIVQAIAKSPKLAEIVRIGVNQAKVVMDERSQKDHPVSGSSYSQMIRQAIISGVSDLQGHVTPLGGE